MSKAPKYKAKPVYWNSKFQSVMHEVDVEICRHEEKLKLPDYIWRFDSQHEFKVYLQLKRMYGVDRVERQVSIRIIPKCNCYPRGKHWKVDFAITKSALDRDITHLVEAKGAFLPKFASVLVNLEREEVKKFEKTIIVFSNKIPSKNLVVKALLKSFYSKNLITLSTLKKLDRLP